MTAALIALGIVVVLVIIMFSIAGYLQYREHVEEQRRTLEVRSRAVETKRQLDAEAFKAAREIQEAILRHGGRR